MISESVKLQSNEAFNNFHDDRNAIWVKDTRYYRVVVLPTVTGNCLRAAEFPVMVIGPRGIFLSRQMQIKICSVELSMACRSVKQGSIYSTVAVDRHCGVA